MSRFLKACQGLPLEIRVAGYRSSLRNLSADYTLDSLEEFYGKESYKPLVGKNFERYLNELVIFKPHLIISDLDRFTSYAALELQTQYWIVSSFITYLGLSSTLKEQLNFVRHYGENIMGSGSYQDRLNFQLKSAEFCFAYSYMGDIVGGPNLEKDYHWIRPYSVGSTNITESQFCAALSYTDKSFINLLSPLNPHIYSETSYEGYRDIESSDYADSITNAYLSFSTGETSLLADAFYNKKYSLVYPDYNSKESIVNSKLIEHYGLGEKIISRKNYEQLNALSSKNLNVCPQLNPDVKYLHQHVMDLI